MRVINVSVDLDIDVADGLASAHYVPDEDKLRAWAQSACLRDERFEASLKIVDSDESRQLNSDYRDTDKPTNVLSFPMQLPEEIEPRLLGDLAVCAEVVAQEAAEQSKTEEAHWAHMIVHGMLHLQGYDHIDEPEAEEMESLEIDILGKLGFPNPYEN